MLEGCLLKACVLKLQPLVTFAMPKAGKRTAGLRFLMIKTIGHGEDL